MSFHLLRHLRRNITQFQTRNVTYMPCPGDGSPRAVTLIPGDGIGPLVTNAVEQVMEAMHAPVYFEKYDVHGKMSVIPSEVIESIKKNKVCLKGGLATPVGGGVSSLNMQLRRELDLYASLVNCFNLPGLPTGHENVDIVVIRENTEGEFSGLEHEVVPGAVESLKVITKFCSERIAKYAFEYAYLNNRKTVTAVHKANIMKLADGLFLESCQEIATKYPGIKYNEIIVDNCCMQLVSKPEQFDVMETKALYHPVVALSNNVYFQKSITSFRSMTTTSDAESASIEGNATASPNVNQPQRIKFKRLDKTAKHIMNILDKEAVDGVRASREIPDIKPGYIVQLKVEVPENKRRVSTLKGIVIARRNAGLNTTFRLHRMVAGVGVESVFPLYSPNIKEVKIIDKKKVRRAKLYYLRDRMNALKK